MEFKDKIRGLRESKGMSRREFSGYFEIPYRTLQDWEPGNRKIPAYLLHLMEYKTRIEGLHIEKTDRKEVQAAGESCSCTLSDTAYLSNIGRYTVFRFRESRLKFIGPYSLERYEKVKRMGCRISGRTDKIYTS